MGLVQTDWYRNSYFSVWPSISNSEFAVVGLLGIYYISNDGMNKLCVELGLMEEILLFFHFGVMMRTQKMEGKTR